MIIVRRKTHGCWGNPPFRNPPHIHIYIPSWLHYSVLSFQTLDMKTGGKLYVWIDLSDSGSKWTHMVLISDKFPRYCMIQHEVSVARSLLHVRHLFRSFKNSTTCHMSQNKLYSIYPWIITIIPQKRTCKMPTKQQHLCKDVFHHPGISSLFKTSIQKNNIIPSIFKDGPGRLPTPHGFAQTPSGGGRGSRSFSWKLGCFGCRLVGTRTTQRSRRGGEGLEVFEDPYGCFQNRGTPKWWFLRENPIKMDDSTIFWKHPYTIHGANGIFTDPWLVGFLW